MIGKTKQISVIIPCFNVEEYIDRCIESVVSQTIGIDNIEIITVNDGSTDDTLVKLKAWENHYPDNILVVTYEDNRKQGTARNIGLQYASGEYIGFVDADDWIEPEMYEELYKAATKSDAEVTVCKYQKDNKIQKVKNDFPREDYFFTFNKKDGIYFSTNVYYGKNGKTGGIVCGLYKRNFIMDNQIFFPEGKIFEDNYWGAIKRLYQRNLYVIDQVYYHYYFNPNSTVESKNNIKQLDRLDIEVGILEEYKKRGAFECYYDLLFEEFLQKYFLNTYYIVFTRFDNIPIDFNEMKKIIQSYFPDYKEKIYKEKYPEAEQTLLTILTGDYIMTDEDEKTLKEVYLKQISIQLHKNFSQ